MIVMDAGTQLKVDIVGKVLQGKISVRDASRLLNRSTRTIERYLASHRKRGILFARHGNRKSSPVNKTSNATRLLIQRLIKEKYYDLNLSHLREMLREKENISINRETLRKFAHEIHHVKRAKKRRRVIRKRRERMPSAGLYGGPKRCHFSQVQRACEELGIEILYANSAEAKGRIERSFDTFQDRLIPELRLNGIKDIEGANNYLKEVFIPKYWNTNIVVHCKTNF